MRLTRDTWFDRLSFTVKIPPAQFEGDGCYVSPQLGVALNELFQQCVAERVLKEELLSLGFPAGEPAQG